MGIITTPGLLINGDEDDYLEKFKELFDGYNEIIIPELPNKPILVFTREDNACRHFWRGLANKGWEEVETRFRAYRLLWIKYVIEDQNQRNIFKDKNGNIIFASTELGFAVVVKDLGKKFKLITSFVTPNPYRWYESNRWIEIDIKSYK